MRLVIGTHSSHRFQLGFIGLIHWLDNVVLCWHLVSHVLLTTVLSFVTFRWIHRIPRRQIALVGQLFRVLFQLGDYDNCRCTLGQMHCTSVAIQWGFSQINGLA